MDVLCMHLVVTAAHGFIPHPQGGVLKQWQQISQSTAYTPSALHAYSWGRGGGREVLRSRLQVYTQVEMQLKMLYTDSMNGVMAHKAT